MKIIILLICTALFAENIGTIVVKVENLRNTDGKIYCSLYDSPEGFPDDEEAPIMSRIVEIHHIDSVYIHFDNIPFGTYAVSLFHDENDNGKMDYNILGIPREGFGFSNNPQVRRRAPKFEETSFQLADSLLEMKVDLVFF